MLKGIDISKWQPVGISYQGYDFVIVKATEGNGYTDPLCDQHYQRAKKDGKLLGVYHFARPDLGNTGEAEAEWFVSQIKGYIGEAILVLDWERNTGNTAWAKAFLDKVYALTGVKPLIYMSASVVNGNNWSAVIEGDYGLWIAGYPPKYNVKNPPTPTVADMPYRIGGWAFWAIWQYSSSAGTLDLNIAALDATAWKKYAAKGGVIPTPTPTPTPAPNPKPTPAPTPAPSTGFKVGDKVTLKQWVDYTGKPLKKTRDYYYISELSGNRAVLRADSLNGVVYCAANTNNLEKIGGTSQSLKVGDKVLPIEWVDYLGTRLKKTRDYYYISQFIGNRAVLRADNAINGAIYAAVYTSNLRKV